MNVRETRLDVVGWIHLIEVREQWRAHANLIMHLRLPQKDTNV
jgi:hypothetical protein